ncbi:hypothetical protein SD70_02690 [Gordoniibacillus kamchatkensis]|uniref:WYL domain-containing protein n=1 Tax=Gordoniibacillus kamchatkensis TaxID=1590651 RepID=A0ABR5AM50_9BACL|nr:hypothetical protein [Paenibacillus sp. VKM B-2647]KIL42107.1 hypothetical protein SD70_02690 [Paenibacillus sp. VKM B-2647]
MEKHLRRYLGRTVELIYIDRRGVFTKRIVQMHSVREGAVKVFCLVRQAPRTFKVENILAVQPVIRRAV